MSRLWKYAYEDLHEDQFEKLIVLLCQRLLGIATQGFAKGPDGGRDAKFVGTAELYPSKSAPWTGTVIVQAKHTKGYNRNFSERDFYNPSSESAVMSEEVPRIKKLREAGQLDHYMLFANRGLPALYETKIRDHISTQCGIPSESVRLCGIEQLEMWMKRFPEVVQEAGLDAVGSPLLISPNEIAEVVQAFAHQKDRLLAVLDNPPTVRVSYEQKNILNNMTAEYAKYQRQRYLKETAQIRTFLAAPENIELLRMYESAVDEIQPKIIAKRKDYQTFDDVMNYLLDILFQRDAVLRQNIHKRLTRALLFYMYWNCDIGEIGDAASDQTLSP